MLMKMRVFLMVGVGLLSGCDSTDPAGSDNPTGPDNSNDVVVITINGINGDRSFAPTVATIKVGQSVAWRNGDTQTHRPILTDVFDTRQLAGGATSAATRITIPNTYEYKCTIHPTMTGTVIVTP